MYSTQLFNRLIGKYVKGYDLSLLEYKAIDNVKRSVRERKLLLNQIDDLSFRLKILDDPMVSFCLENELHIWKRYPRIVEYSFTDWLIDWINLNWWIDWLIEFSK